jgi:hypothetical protein
MKRLFLATVILLAGTIGIRALRNATNEFQRQADETRATLLTQTQLIAEAQTQLTRVEEHIRELKQNLRMDELAGGPGPAGSLLSLAGASHFSTEQSERLLAELGFSWKGKGDYLIVSKDTLRAISLDGIQQTNFSGIACDILAIKPDERARLDAMLQSLRESYKTWAEASVQRSEPAGDIVAKYSLPADAEFSQSLSNRFSSGILAALGDERGNLLLEYSRNWMKDLGMAGNGDTTLTVKRYKAGDQDRLNFEFRYGGNVVSSLVHPFDSFPRAFLPLFPNGWADLAAREGFELPAWFRRK